MKSARGQLAEIILDEGQRAARFTCPADLIPAPGEYLLASDASNSPLPIPLFYTDSTPQGFLASPLIPDLWMPGMDIFLRGPLGHGFTMSTSARKVGLIAFDSSPSRLRGLIGPALKQGAAVVLVSDFSSGNLPDDVEVQPSSALLEIIEWADYVAIDVRRENLLSLREKLGTKKQAWAMKEAELLIHTPMPCGGVADCGVCAVMIRSGWKMACRDGPVFDLDSGL